MQQNGGSHILKKSTTVNYNQEKTNQTTCKLKLEVQESTMIHCKKT